MFCSFTLALPKLCVQCPIWFFFFCSFLMSCFPGKLLRYCLSDFTSMLPCIVVDFFLNNQPDALIIQILFCYKTLHVSGIFSAHHQEFYAVHSALVSFMQVFDDRFQAESGCSILTLMIGRKDALYM